MTQVLEKICIVCRREFPKDVQECPDDLVRLTEKDPLLGTIFDGKFEIIDFIGVGGLSRVYKARHVELNRIYAIKVLKSTEFIDLQRFRREAISIGLLDHPNIGRVFSFSVANNGRPYMVLEYIEGKDLSDLLAKEPLSPNAAIEIFVQVCAAIAHAHAHGVIHRDIKPGNFIVLSHPQDQTIVKVVDFGMARILNEGKDAQKLTRTGEIFGTRQYISPEQYAGSPADERADIYSLGVSLKEALGSIKASENLKKIIDKATAADPKKRYSSAEEMRAELREIQENPNMDVGGSSTGSSNFQLWSLVLGLLLLGVAGFIYLRATIQTEISPQVQRDKRSISTSVPLRYAATESLANDLIAKGKLQRAEEVLKSWYEKNKASASNRDLAFAVMNIMSCLAAQDRTDEAKQICDDVIAIINSRSKGPDEDSDRMHVAFLLLTRGKCDLVARRSADARKSIESAIDLLKGIDSEAAVTSIVQAYTLIAQAYQDEKNLPEAEKWARRSYKLAVETSGEASRVTAAADEILASILIEQKRFAEAKPIVDSAILIRRETTPSTDVMYYLNLLTMRVLYEAGLGEDEQAKSHLAEIANFLAKFNPGIHKPMLDRVVPKLDQVSNELGFEQKKRTWTSLSHSNRSS